MSSKIKDLLYIPTEEECIRAICLELNNFYVISQRGDITITSNMKVAAFQMFRKTKQNPLSGLSDATDAWFIRTQLRGWRTVLPRSVLPYGFTDQQINTLLNQK